MNYVAESNIKSNLYGSGRQMHRTDGIFPTATMRLHQRVVGWHRKRRIPVRDADKPSTLNAYLIDPKYLENNEVVPPKELPSVQERPQIPIYQYSRITHDASTVHPTSGPLTQATLFAFNTIRAGFVALVAEIAARFQNVSTATSRTHYAVQSGASPLWKHRLKLLPAVVFGGMLLVAAASFGSNPATTPTPVQANPNSANTRASVNDKNTHTNSLAAQSATQPSPSTSSITMQPATSVRTSSPNTIPYQQSLATGAQQTVAPTSSISSPTATPTAPTSTSSQTAPSTTTSSDPLAPILDPVTKTVNDLLSTQIIVNAPL